MDQAPPGKIIYGDNLPVLEQMPSGSVDLIYIDPPFNTGKKQSRTRIRTVKSESGDRIGFQGNSYTTVAMGKKEYDDRFGEDFVECFIKPRLLQAYRILASTGSLYFHIDYREVHYCKVLLDKIFGRECFINEIIWAYDYGGKAKNRWPAKHDNILYYVKNPEDYVFDSSAVNREPYMAPGLVGSEKAARGKLPTDTWWHTIVGTNSRERTGYPTQKPLGVINRIVQASSLPGQTVFDFFAGSGTVGESCLSHGRNFLLIDNNPTAMEVMARRFPKTAPIEWVNFDPSPYQE
jgi:site-specific DNA-methyltransferase (adenine-specific)